jgi:heavy-metal resistance protein
MIRSWLILVGGLVIGLAAYGGFYYAATAHCRSLARSPEPELAWLKDEFHLGDAEFERISKMHEAYLAGCAERCRRIDEKNQQLRQFLAATNTVTPQIEQALAESARLRAQCQKLMLEHFFAVSRTMPPAQGQRYLAWVQARTVLSNSHEGMHPSAQAASHMDEHH